MSAFYNNWKPVVGSLVRRLKKEGFTLQNVNDGEEVIPVDNNNKLAVESICAVDEAWLGVTTPALEHKSIFIVLGNGPEEIVCDYTCDEYLDIVVDDHYKEWELKKTPRISKEDYYKELRK